MTREGILKELERVKWFLWHGNVFRADETLTDLMFEVDGAIEEDREARRPTFRYSPACAPVVHRAGSPSDGSHRFPGVSAAPAAECEVSGSFRAWSNPERIGEQATKVVDRTYNVN